MAKRKPILILTPALKRKLRRDVRLLRDGEALIRNLIRHAALFDAREISDSELDRVDVGPIWEVLRQYARSAAGAEQFDMPHDGCPVCSANVYGRVRVALDILDKASYQLKDLMQLTQPSHETHS